METNTQSPYRIVVLIGGNGSNLQALIDKTQRGSSYEIAGVISHRPDAYGLVRAQIANLPSVVVDHQQFASRQAFETALIAAISHFNPHLIVLAGFMRILSAHFVQSFAQPILNIHPALLPNYKGLNTHQRVLEAGDEIHGVSVHLVNEELDSGPLIARVTVPVLPTDDVTCLRERVLVAEHWLYPQIVEWFAENRLKYAENLVTLDDKQIGPQGLLLSLPSAQGIVS